MGRLAATGPYVTTVSVGDRATAERLSERVRRIHEHVRGTDPVTGQPYAACDPGLLLWVHAALVDSTDRDRPAVRRRPVRGQTRTGTWPRWWPRPSWSVFRATWSRRAGCAGRVPDLGPPDPAGHPGRAGVHGLPARPARPGPGRGRDLAGRAGGNDRVAAGLGPRPVRLRAGRPADRRAPRPRSGRHSGSWTWCSWPSPACSKPASGWPCACAPPAPPDHPADHEEPAATDEKAHQGRPVDRRLHRGWRLRPCSPGAGPAGCGWAAAWPRSSSWPGAGPGTPVARRGCSWPRGSSASSCATTWPCRPPKTSPPPWAR